jgi:hypothetical protein
MTNYSVQWEIEIKASSPEEAAREALRIQRDPESLATVFDVYHEEPTGRVELNRIDLAETNERSTDEVEA